MNRKTHRKKNRRARRDNYMNSNSNERLHRHHRRSQHIPLYRTSTQYSHCSSPVMTQPRYDDDYRPYYASPRSQRQPPCPPYSTRYYDDECMQNDTERNDYDYNNGQYDYQYDDDEYDDCDEQDLYYNDNKNNKNYDAFSDKKTTEKQTPGSNALYSDILTVIAVQCPTQTVQWIDRIGNKKDPFNLIMATFHTMPKLKLFFF